MQKTERRRRWEAEAGLRRFEPVSDEEVIAAVDRAERHRERKDRDPGVPWWVIIDHLAFVNNGWTTRQLRPQLEGLVAGGMLKTSRRHSQTYWTLTSAARERVAAWGRAGKAPDLPESPQHRTWRMAHTYAAENIDRLRVEVSGDLERTVALLARGRRVRSDAWFELRERLSRRLWRVGSATYCMYEWQEPDDATPDVDDGEDPGDERLSEAARVRLRSLRGGRRKPDSWRWRDDEEGLLRSEPPPMLVTVPAELVGELRAGLYNELAVPAERVLEIVSRADRLTQPEQYHEHFDYLDELSVLLDVVGWERPRQQTALVIDLRRHRRAVIAALNFAVRSSVDELGAAEKAVPSKRDVLAKRAAALCDFAASSRRWPSRSSKEKSRRRSRDEQHHQATSRAGRLAGPCGTV